MPEPADKTPEELEDSPPESGPRGIPPDELEEILDRHRLWLDSRGEEGERADFHRAILQDAYLQGADLRAANFHQASLQGAELQNANLHKADLSEAHLRHASLQKSSLREANL